MLISFEQQCHLATTSLSYELAALRLANIRAGCRCCLDRACDRWASCGRSCCLDDRVLGLRLGGRGLQEEVSKWKSQANIRECLTGVTVMTTFVTPDQKVSVEVVVMLVSTSCVSQVVVAGAVDIEVEVAHLLVSSSVRVTVPLSRPRFWITWASARRASRAARNSARLSAATCLFASRRRWVPVVVAATDVVNDAVSRAAAYTTVGVILAQGSW